MRPLMFVNWSSVNARFTALMWLVAIILAIVVLGHAAAGGSGAPGPTHLRAVATSAPPATVRSR